MKVKRCKTKTGIHLDNLERERERGDLYTLMNADLKLLTVYTVISYYLSIIEGDCKPLSTQTDYNLNQ